MKTIHRHHLLEIILWPKGDGTFREIVNSAARLKELGIYDDYKLTIEVSASEHVTMHNAVRTYTEETKQKLSSMKVGKKLSASHRKAISEGMKGTSNVKGKHWTLSPEQRKAISERMKGRRKHECT